MGQNLRLEESYSDLIIMPDDRYIQFRLRARLREYLKEFDPKKALHEQLKVYFPFEILRILINLKRVEKNELCEQTKRLCGSSFNEKIFNKAFEDIQGLCLIPPTDDLIQEVALSRIISAC